MNKNKCGFSLLEIVLYLGVVSMSIILIFIIFDQVRSYKKIKIENNNITTIKIGVKNLYNSSSSYTGLNTESAIKANIIPSHMIDLKAKIIKHSFNGNVEIIASSNLESFNSTFKIIYSNVPTRECSKIILNIGSGFLTVNINGFRIKEYNEKINKEEVIKICNWRDLNEIVFVSE